MSRIALFVNNPITPADLKPWLEGLSTRNSLLVLWALDDPKQLSWLIEKLKTHSHDVKVINYSENKKNWENRARRLFLNFNFRYQKHALPTKGSILKALQLHPALSAWWFTFWSQRPSNQGSTMILMSHLFFIREALRTYRPNTLTLYTSSPSLKWFFFKSKTKFKTTHLAPNIPYRRLAGIRLRYAVKCIVQSFLLDLYSVFRKNKSYHSERKSHINHEWGEFTKNLIPLLNPSTQNPAWIFSLYGTSWNTKGYERFLGPNLSKAIDDPRFRFFSTLRGGASYVDWPWYKDSLKKNNEGIENHQLHLMDNDLSLCDVLKGYLGFPFIKFLLSLLYCQIARHPFAPYRPLKRFFIEDGISSIYTVATAIPQYFLGRRFGKKYKPKSILAYGFEFSQQWALLTGIKEGNPDVTLIGLQHCFMNENYTSFQFTKNEHNKNNPKIEQIPLIDKIIVDGTLPKSLLVESGYDPENIIELGPIRFEDRVSKWQNPGTQIWESPSEQSTLLVALGLKDWDRFLPWLSNWSLSHQFKKIIIKPHPATVENFSEFESFFNTQDHLLILKIKSKLEIGFGKLEDHIALSTHMITSESGSGVEAVLQGKQVMSIGWSDQIDLYPLRDLSVQEHVKLISERIDT